MALDIDPTYLPAMNNKANALAEQGSIDEAIKIYDSILKQDPLYEIAQNNLQRAQKNLDAHTSTNQQASLIVVDYPTEKPLEIESTGTTTEQTDIQTSNILEQIGNVFAGLFGFLK
jgi:tetratricopeptide (TPR) repeat protein